MTVLIYAKLSEAIGKINAVGKDQKNQHQGYQYRGIDQAMNALNGVLSECGLALSVHYNLIDQQRVTKEGKDTATHMVTVQGDYAIYAEDGSCITSTTVAVAHDTSDKACGKAMSYCFKYFIFQAFCIPTQEMEDIDKDDIKVPAVKPRQDEGLPKHIEVPAGKKDEPRYTPKQLEVIGIAKSRNIDINKLNDYAVKRGHKSFKDLDNSLCDIWIDHFSKLSEGAK